MPGRVCWQVTGVRKDPWARAHPVVVEEPKIGDESGHYLNPELFGQREDQSIMAARYPNLGRAKLRTSNPKPRTPNPAPCAAESLSFVRP